MSVGSWILFGIAAFGCLAMAVELVALRVLRRRRVAEPSSYPSFSILKPLCGLDDELWENLESHVQLDYPAPYEVLLGVRSTQDAAYPVAQRFARAHPDKVRLVLQQGEPGHNPKVNQLITLMRESRHELFAVTDSNVRVHRTFLKEHAALLEEPSMGLSSHLFVGVGEQRLGSILDNMTLASFCAPNVAAGSLLLQADQIVGKSIAMKPEALAKAGGWAEFKDLLAEDQRLGRALRRQSLRTALCPTPVLNIQRTQTVAQFWARHSRWAMIRFRVLPGVVGEPVLNPFVLALAGALLAPYSGLAWALCGGVGLYSIAFTQLCARAGRGYGFRWWHLPLVLVRDVLFFLIWVRGATLRFVTWRGTRLLVLAKTRLAEPDAVERMRKMHRLGR